jgi:hypothetical protein
LKGGFGKEIKSFKKEVRLFFNKGKGEGKGRESFGPIFIFSNSLIRGPCRALPHHF